MSSLFSSSVSAGFPSPVEDLIEKDLDLNELLVKHPASTFFVKVKGDSMVNAGIIEGDILIVDKSKVPVNNNVIIVYLNGEFTVKRFLKENNYIYLIPENTKYKIRKIESEDDFLVWGVVIYAIHSL